MPSRRPVVLLLGIGLAVAACGAPATSPSAPAAATLARSDRSPAITLPTAPTQASSTPAEGATAIEDAPEAEAALLHGARLDLQGRCAALRAGLPDGAVGAISCTAQGDTAAGVTMTLFDTQAQMLAAYGAAVAAEGGPLRTHGGRCEAAGASEGGYVPGDGHAGVVVNERLACWVDVEGVAHSLVTGPPFLLFRVDGRPGAAPSDVGLYAMLGNVDQPGGPTLWAEEPRSPEK